MGGRSHVGETDRRPEGSPGGCLTATQGDLGCALQLFLAVKICPDLIEMVVN